MRIFENPANGHRETVSELAWLWALLFGFFYLMIAGVWGHAFVYLGILIVAGLLSGGPALVIVAPLTWLIYAASIGGILERKYLRQGWREVGAEGSAPPPKPPSTGRVNAAPDPAPTSAAAAAPSAAFVADAIIKLAELKDRGVLTADEFAEQKAALLASRRPATPAPPAPPPVVTPKGYCPVCKNVVAMDAKECPRCDADFGSYSKFKPEPL